jgi:hypothetical protein
MRGDEILGGKRLETILSSSCSAALLLFEATMDNECEDENQRKVVFLEGRGRIQILPNVDLVFHAEPGFATFLYISAGCGWVGIPALSFGICARLLSFEHAAAPAFAIGCLPTLLWLVTFGGQLNKRWPIQVVIDTRNRFVIVDEVTSLGRWRRTDFPLGIFKFLRVDSFRSKGGTRYHVVLAGDHHDVNLACFSSDFFSCTGGADANTTAAELAKILALAVRPCRDA